MSRQTSRLLVQLCCLFALSAIANAASVASRISQHAKSNPAATRSVTRTLRRAAKVARAPPVADERRGLAESDFSMCDFIGDSISCSFAGDSRACARKTGCQWDGESCVAPLDEAGFLAALEGGMIASYTQALVCYALTDSSACEAEENCEFSAACNPSEAFFEDTITDPITAQIVYAAFACASISDQDVCNDQPNCAYAYDDDQASYSCGMSEDASESIIWDALLQCDLDESIADGAGAVVAAEVDLCPVAKAQIECMQITTESACNSATKCEWADPDDSDDPHDTKYPCTAKEEHMSPMLEVFEANYGVALRAYGECANEYTSESTCEGDEECEWNGEENVCEANELKLFRAMGNAHPHFARYYQIDATCSAFDQSSCGTGDSANKCAWSAASVGGDASCVPTIRTFAEVMSCECPTEIAAAAPTVDTSSGDCAEPDIPEWLVDDDDSAASCVAGSAFVATAAAALAALA